MSHRKEQLESTLKRAIGEILAEGLSDPRITGLISVTSVRVSPDLHHAMVFISIMPESSQELTMHGLRHAARHIRSQASRKMRVRQMPYLEFRLDPSLKKQAEVLDAIRHAVEREDARPAPENPSPDEAVPPREEEDRT